MKDRRSLLFIAIGVCAALIFVVAWSYLLKPALFLRHKITFGLDPIRLDEDSYRLALDLRDSNVQSVNLILKVGDNIKSSWPIKADGSRRVIQTIHGFETAADNILEINLFGGWLEQQDSLQIEFEYEAAAAEQDAMPVRVREGLRNALKDKSASIRALALDRVLEFEANAKHLASEIVPLLRDGDKAVRNRAFSAAAKIGRGDVITPFLTQDDLKVAVIAVEALGTMKSAAAMYAPAIARLLTVDDASVQIASINALGRMPDAGKQYADKISILLDNDNGMVRSSAAAALAEMGDSRYGDRVFQMALRNRAPATLQTKWSEVAGKMAMTVPSVLTGIGQALDQSQDLDLQIFAIDALRAMGRAGAIYAPKIAEIMATAGKDQSDFGTIEYALERSAYLALVQFGEAGVSAAPQIFEALLEAHNTKAGNFVEVLTSMGNSGKEYASGVATEVIRRKQILFYVEESEGSEALAAAFVEFLDNEDLAIKQQALIALRNVRTSNAVVVSRLVDLLSVSAIRTFAIDALKGSKNIAPVHAPQIAELWDSSDDGTRAELAAILSKMGQAGAIYAPKVAELLVTNSLGGQSETAALALARMGDAGARFAPGVAEVMMSSKSPDSRKFFIPALGGMGEWGAIYAPQIATFLLDEESQSVALSTLQDMNLSTAQVPVFLQNGKRNESVKTKYRYLAHLAAGGDAATEFLIDLEPTQLPPDFKERLRAIRYLQLLRTVWPSTKDQKDVRDDVADAMTEISKKASFDPVDRSLLQSVEDDLRKANYDSQADSIAAAHGSTWRPWMIWLLRGWGFHIAAILLLVFFYPWFRPVQAMFIWKPRLRRYLGLSYVDIAVTVLPFTAAWFFKPFKDTLRSGARLKTFDNEEFFDEVCLRQIVPKHDGTISLRQFRKSLRKIVVVQGESGLGKTMLLRWLTKESNRALVFLNAAECAAGVEDAIRGKLEGFAREDAAFLKMLLYSGVMDVYIDGLNEVSPQTCVQITNFLEKYSRGNVVLATQRIAWDPPGFASVYETLPLDGKDRLAFLKRQWNATQTKLTKEQYETSCKEFLSHVTGSSIEPDLRDEYERVLSTPVDLTIIADILMKQRTPNLRKLRRQQFEAVAEEYSAAKGRVDFPLDGFAHFVYQLRLADKKEFWTKDIGDKLASVIPFLEREKLIRSRTEESKEEFWTFRHDTIMEFFIAEHFLKHQEECVEKHFEDPRFRGVYLLLIEDMPLDAARQLRELIVRHGAETNDNVLSNAIVLRLANREKREAA